MEEIPAELFPIQAASDTAFPELHREDWLLQSMAIEPISPAAVRAYANRRFLLYSLLFVALIVLPGLILGLNFLLERGWPLWLVRTGIFLTLGAFFLFFFAILAVLLSRFRAIKHLGIAPAKPGQGSSQDASMLAKRHGRILEYGVLDSENFWRYAKPFPVFRIENRGGQFFASPGLPPRVHGLLSRLPTEKIWNRLRIQSGPQGVQTSRPVGRAGYFLQDLWLLEEMLNVLEKSSQ
ncbi:MAG TPA: hypothetical protein VJR29_14320 [bacterium]|nr:hypothetical protein [bacterium]